MGPGDQLGKAGRTARDLQEGDVRRVGVSRGQIHRIRTEPVEIDQLLGLADHDHMAQFRNLGLHRSGQGAIVEAFVPIRHDIGRGFGTLHEMDDLGRAVRRQGVNRDQPGPEQAEDDAEKLGDIGHLHHDPIPGLQPQRQKTRRCRLGAIEQFAIGPARLHPDHRHGVGLGLGAAAQHLRKGLATPVALGAIERRHIVRPDLLQGDHRLVSSIPRARRTAWNLPEVSSASAVGSEPSTMPAPA